MSNNYFLRQLNLQRPPYSESARHLEQQAHLRPMVMQADLEMRNNGG